MVILAASLSRCIDVTAKVSLLHLLRRVCLDGGVGDPYNSDPQHLWSQVENREYFSFFFKLQVAAVHLVQFQQ